MWRTTDPFGLWVRDVNQRLDVFIGPATAADNGRLTQTDAQQLFASTDFSTDLANPAAWPSRAVG